VTGDVTMTTAALELLNRLTLSLAKEVVGFAPGRATLSAYLQELSESVAAIECLGHIVGVGPETSRMPASARQPQDVPVSYPRSV
jgi:hypothetical protein